MTKVSQDLRDEIRHKAIYDEFLKKKMENLQEEMERIEKMIERFSDTTLLGINREGIKDSFSEVSASLEAIAKDLGQDRVEIVTTPTLDENDPSNPGQKKKGSK